MISFSTITALLPWQDWSAAVIFLLAWVAYAMFARNQSKENHSLLVLTNRERRRWMLTSTYRENRVFDGVITQTLSASPSFFASTTILIIGGVIAMLGTTEKASEFVREIPFAARTSALVFDLKLFALLGIFIYAFFRFTWSLRLYSFGALLVASAPDSAEFAKLSELTKLEPKITVREAFADRAGKVMGMAAETFNDGLRAYYMSFAVIAWFFSPIAFGIATAAVIFVLYRREFKSDVLGILNQ